MLSAVPILVFLLSPSSSAVKGINFPSPSPKKVSLLLRSVVLCGHSFNDRGADRRVSRAPKSSDPMSPLSPFKNRECHQELHMTRLLHVRVCLFSSSSFSSAVRRSRHLDFPSTVRRSSRKGEGRGEEADDKFGIRKRIRQTLGKRKSMFQGLYYLMQLPPFALKTLIER